MLGGCAEKDRRGGVSEVSHIRFLTRAWRNGWRSTREKQWTGVRVVIQLSVKMCSLTSPLALVFTGKSAANALDLWSDDDGGGGGAVL